MRQRVRPLYSPDDLARLYSQPRQPANSYADHPSLANCPNPEAGDLVTIAMGQSCGKISSLADMSCGSGEIPRAIAAYSGIEPILGDYGPGWEYQGPITETVPQLPVVDLFVLSQTLEHLDDPDGDLRLIREHCRQLLVASPIDEVDPVEDHYWTWGKEDLEEMMGAAGFTVSAFIEFDMTPLWYPHCKFGIWAMR